MKGNKRKTNRVSVPKEKKELEVSINRLRKENHEILIALEAMKIAQIGVNRAVNTTTRDCQKVRFT